MCNISTNSPLISVILPTYNGEKYLAETLESVLNQTYTNLEIIIVDDCSTDSTIDIIKSYNDERIKLYVNEKNLGIGDNTNKALSLATGEFIMMQDHDDISSPSRAELQLKCLIDHPDVTGVTLNVKSFKGNPPIEIYNILDTYHIDKTANEFRAIQIYRYPAHQTIFYRRSILDNLDSYYSNQFIVAGDLYFIVKLNLAGATWILLTDYLVAYRSHQQMATKHNMQSISNSKRQTHNDVVNISATYAKGFIKDISDQDALLHARIMVMGRLDKIDNTRLVNHFKKLLSLNKNNNFCDNIVLKEETTIRFKTALILANIYSPVKAYKLYRSIDELKPYTVSFWKFLREYRKRLFANSKTKKNT